MVITIIIFLSVLGFLNAFYLYLQHKREVRTGKKMFCLIGGDCGAVVGSKYGRTFGVKNEITGMVYYFLLALYGAVAIFIPNIALNSTVFVKVAVAIALVFSFYLLFIQTIVLKKFCSWCLIAIAVNTLIAYLLLI